VQDAELMPPSERVLPAADPTGSRHGRALCEAAVTLATTGQADAIVAVTREGKTARLLSSLRPIAPIYAVTGSGRAAATLALYWGVQPVVAAERDPEALEAMLLERGTLAAGAVVVFISISADLTRPDSNFLNVQKIG
jgi:pyruvate kinase